MPIITSSFFRPKTPQRVYPQTSKVIRSRPPRIMTDREFFFPEITEEFPIGLSDNPARIQGLAGEKLWLNACKAQNGDEFEATVQGSVVDGWRISLGAQIRAADVKLLRPKGHREEYVYLSFDEADFGDTHNTLYPVYRPDWGNERLVNVGIFSFNEAWKASAVEWYSEGIPSKSRLTGRLEQPYRIDVLKVNPRFAFNLY